MYIFIVAEDGNGKNPSQKTKATVSARGEGYDSSTATAATPTLTRRNGETIASVDSSIPQQKTERNEKVGSFSIGKDGKKFTATLEESLGVEFAKDHAEALATLAGSYGGREKDGKYTVSVKQSAGLTLPLPYEIMLSIKATKFFKLSQFTKCA